MSAGIDPDDPAQFALVYDVLYGPRRNPRGNVYEAMAALRDLLASQPRVIELPAEDRGRKWRDTQGRVWEVMVSSASPWWGTDGHHLILWTDLLGRFGPLTDAGTADVMA